MIRWATMADVPRIVEMSMEFYSNTHYPDIIGTTKEQMAGLAIITMKDHVLLVAEKEGHVCGMISLLVEDFIFNPAIKSASELVWWLDETARGGMLAVRLLKQAEKECVNVGVKLIRMALMHDSPAHAEGIYLKQGYRKSDSHYEKVL